MKKIKLATLCSGIGSPETAIQELAKENSFEVEHVFACDIDKYARASFLANFEVNQMFNDMTTQSWARSDIWPIEDKLYSDVVVGGIPCQSFSIAGKRLGEMDPRGLLFFDYHRYVKNQQPKVFIIENVKGLLSDNKGKTFQNWLLLLGNSVNGHRQMFNHPDSLGYNLHHTVLNSKNFGVPQNRERVFIVGIRRDLPNTFRFPSGFRLDKVLRDICEENIPEKYYLSDKMVAGFISKENRGYINQDTQASQVHDINGIAPTLSSGTHGYANGYIIEVGQLNSSQDGRVLSMDGISQCLSSGHNNSPKILEIKAGRMCGRNPDNPTQRIAGQYQEQTIEINQNPDITNCLSTVQKDNIIIEGLLSGGNEMRSRVYSDMGISPTITAKQGGGMNLK